MKIFTLLEGRRNPAENEKRGVLNELKEFVSKNGTEGFFVHFTSIHKIGMNPDPGYSGTPIGIYTYPLDYVMKNMGDDGLPKDVMPYAGDYSFAYIIKPKTQPISLQDSEVCLPFVKKIEQELGEEHLSELFKLINSNKTSHLHFARMCKKDSDGNYVNPGRALYALPYLLFHDLDGFPEKQVLLRWMKLYRDIGITGLIDRSDSQQTAIIHINEPTQAVFFDIDDLEIKQVLENNVASSKYKASFNRTNFGKKAALRTKTAGARQAVSRHVCADLYEKIFYEVLDQVDPYFEQVINSDDVKHDGKLVRRAIIFGLRDVVPLSVYNTAFNKISKNFEFIKEMSEDALSELKFIFINENGLFRTIINGSLADYGIKGITKLTISTKKLLVEEYRRQFTNKIFPLVANNLPVVQKFSKSELAKLKTVDELDTFLDYAGIDDENVDEFIKAFGRNRLADLISNMSNHQMNDPLIKVITHKVLGVEQ